MSAVLDAAARLHRFPGGYALAYGSHATAPRPTSDLDLLFTGSRPLPEEHLQTLIDGVKELHATHHLQVDEEVGYATKLYATHHQIQQAAALEGFNGLTDCATLTGRPDLLNSPRFKLRLILNALTTPHIFLTGDVHRYRKHVTLAERGCALLALHLTQVEKPPVSELLQALLSSPEGQTGKLFLGYRPGPHLHAVLRRGLGHLEHDGLIRIHDSTITRSNP